MEEGELEADVIIAGGGTTGCVIAARLAQALPDLDIIVVESGKDTKDDQRVTRPLDGMFSVYEGADQRSSVSPQQAFRNSGWEISGMSSGEYPWMYNNPAASDFDDWNQPGWSFDDLRPYIKRSEAWDASPNGVHGHSGKMPVTTRGQDSPMAEAYFKAWSDVKGVPKVDDLVDYRTAHGCGYFPKLIDNNNGHRSNTAHAYLRDLPSSSRVRILTRKTVIRVLLDQSASTPRATGLEICDAPNSKLDDTVINLQTVRARKMVIVCGGAFGTPMILERSGVGASSFLQGLGVETVVDLPGVGEGYQDHELTICAYRVTDDSDTLDDYPRGVKAVKDGADDEWERTGRGMAGTNGFDYGFKIRPSEEDIKSMGPEFEAHWNKVARDKPDKPLYSGPLVNYFMGPQSRPPNGRYFSLGAFTNYPAGRGSVHISSSNPHAPPDFDAGLLSHPADLPPHIWAYKLQREVARRMPNFIGEYAPAHPVFPSGSAAGLVELATPVPPGDIRWLKYSAEDDKAIAQWVRKTVGTAYHSMSTCRMKVAADGGVVDGRLRVHGTEGLYVADLSICAENMGCNTTTVAVVIGEKASSVLVEELGRDA